MTRINLVPVHTLADQHLISEYKEIPRVSGLVRRCKKRGVKIPENYRFGTGHVKFFYNKGLFLKKRFKKLVREMENRGMRPKYKNYIIWPFILKLWYKDWTPCEVDIALSQRRIDERLSQKKNYYRYYGKYI